MEAFVLGDFTHRAHTVCVLTWTVLIRSSAPHPGETQKSPVKEAQQVPSVPPVPALSYPPSSDLKPSCHLQADKTEFIPELNVSDRGRRDMVSNFAKFW